MSHALLQTTQLYCTDKAHLKEKKYLVLFKLKCFGKEKKEKEIPVFPSLDFIKFTFQVQQVSGRAIPTQFRELEGMWRLPAKHCDFLTWVNLSQSFISIELRRKAEKKKKRRKRNTGYET